ncbi:MAG: cytochrome c [Chloroflexota bacterium]|jgi:disulfide bond formation protein DsbB|nr:cytochrome c [Chloroflexota bacterium]
MKRYFWIVTVTALALALAACGGKKEPTPAPEPPAAAAEAAAPAAEPVGDAAAGKDLFVPTCGACHGPEGKGVTGLGKDMTHSEFIAEKTDAELLEFIKVGRAPDDPLNTTGVLMPPKGGNPALTDQQLMDIIAYVRSIHE